MKKAFIISILINVLLTIIIVSMYNTIISWNYDGKDYSYKLGHFYTEGIGLKHE